MYKRNIRWRGIIQSKIDNEFYLKLCHILYYNDECFTKYILPCSIWVLVLMEWTLSFQNFKRAQALLSPHCSLACWNEST